MESITDLELIVGIWSRKLTNLGGLENLIWIKVIHD